MRLPALALLLLALASSDAVATELIVDADAHATKANIPVGVVARAGGGKEILLFDTRNPAFCKRLVVYIHGEFRAEKVVGELAGSEFDTQYKFMNEGDVCALDAPSAGFLSFNGTKADEAVLERLLSKLGRWRRDRAELDVGGASNLVECLHDGAVRLVSFVRSQDSEYELVLASDRCAVHSDQLRILISGRYDPQHATLKLATLPFSKDP